VIGLGSLAQFIRRDCLGPVHDVPFRWTPQQDGWSLFCRQRDCVPGAGILLRRLIAGLGARAGARRPGGAGSICHFGRGVTHGADDDARSSRISWHAVVPTLQGIVSGQQTRRPRDRRWARSRRLEPASVLGRS
jgi:hypothetical protein